MVIWRDKQSPTPCWQCRHKVQGQNQQQRCCLKPGSYREFKRDQGGRSFVHSLNPCRQFEAMPNTQPQAQAQRREWRAYAE